MGPAHGRSPRACGAWGLRDARLDGTGLPDARRRGWQWYRTRCTDPARVDRHWLVLAVATLWVLAHGTRVEETRLRGQAPGLDKGIS